MSTEPLTGPYHITGKRNCLGTYTVFYGHGETASNQVCQADNLPTARLLSASWLLVQAARTCRAWHVSESEHRGTFEQRSELCNYSEWLTRKALAAVDGVPFDEPYQGVPYLLLTDGEQINPHISRASESQAAALVGQMESPHA